MLWRFADCEDDARELRAFAGVQRDAVLSARAIGRGAGVTFTVRAARGCEGQVQAWRRRVYLHARGYASTQNFNNAHELAHFAHTLLDRPAAHEESFADWTALALLLPRAPVAEVVRRVGLRDPRALAAAFPEVPAARVVLRAAWVWGRAVAVHRRGERMVWAPEGYAVPPRGDYAEQRMVRRVRMTGGWEAELSRYEAFPLGETGADGVVVLLPEDQCAAVGW